MIPSWCSSDLRWNASQRGKTCANVELPHLLCKAEKLMIQTVTSDTVIGMHAVVARQIKVTRMLLLRIVRRLKAKFHVESQCQNQ